MGLRYVAPLLAPPKDDEVIKVYALISDGHDWRELPHHFVILGRSRPKAVAQTQGSMPDRW